MVQPVRQFVNLVAIILICVFPAFAQEELPRAPQQQWEELQRYLPPGLEEAPVHPVLRMFAYTSRSGAFVVETNFLATRSAIFRSQPLNADGSPGGPIRAYDHNITYLWYTHHPWTREPGFLCFVYWHTKPWDQMPILLFFSDVRCHHHHCHCGGFGGYHVFSFRLSRGWRFVDTFTRTALDEP